jgi:radical SAM protein with 4Fe4S-binding SPASM domain
MIDYAQRSGLGIRLSTNGIALNKELAKKILDYDLAAIEISMDGYNEKEYFNGKQINKFNEAKANVLYFLEVAKLKKVKTVFNIHFVDAGNVSFLNKLRFIRFWRGKLNGLKSATTFYYEPHNWAGTRNDISIRTNFLDRILSKWELKKPCVYINGLNINWNGDVQICSNDPTGSAVIGNINNELIEEVYNNKKRMNYLDENEKGTFKDLNCGVCSVNSIFPLLFFKKKFINIIIAIFSKK